MSAETAPAAVPPEEEVELADHLTLEEALALQREEYVAHTLIETFTEHELGIFNGC